MKKEELIQILYKYGFHSLTKEPFLYEGKLGIGISYTFKDSLYGSLTRVIIPEDLEAAEDFCAKYYWYKKNASKYKIEIKLSDYKTENPKISFVQNNQELDLQNMKDLKILKEEKNDIKENSYLKKIKRTALLMIIIIEEKINTQNTTHLNLLNIQKKHLALLEELEKKKQEYNNQKEVIKKKEAIEEDIKDYKNDLLEMKEYVKTATKEELIDYINILSKFLKSLEASDSFIHNKYELIRLPLQIEITEKQINVLTEAQKKKKGMFSKKENILELLGKEKLSSPIKNIVSFESYKENELKRIEEKYAMLPDIDIRTIGDFFIEFDNLTIKEPLIEEEKKEVKNTITYSYEETMKELENNFSKRSKEEQQILVLYHSILKNIRIYLEMNETILINEHIKDFIELIDNPNNIIFKIKYFKNIDTSSIEKCKKSLVKELDKIKNIKTEKILSEINVFFKDGKKITNRQFIEASNKKAFVPTQKIEDNDVTFLATLKENTNVYFIPTEITYDFENEDTLIQKNNQPFFLIDMKKNSIIKSNSDILRVVIYKEVKKKTDLCTIVSELNSNKIELYQEITIGGINSNE